MRNHLSLSLAVFLGLTFVVAGCSPDDDTATSDSTTMNGPRVTGAITVSAAASLTEAFTTIKEAFVTANPDATVTVNFGASGQLATQIRGGAPADVVAFADGATMKTLSDGNLLAAPARIFAKNHLVIVTKPGNPQRITKLADLASAGTISLCGTSAPCGRLADRVLRAADVTVPTGSITRGQDVKATLTAVTDGDADAALVYVTDAMAAGSTVDTVETPEADKVLTGYPIAVITASRNRVGAQAFEDFVLGDEGRAALRDAGFLDP